MDTILCLGGTIQTSSDITGSEHLNEDLPGGQNNLCVWVLGF